MPLLALLRHGPTKWTIEHRLQGRADLPLSAEGRADVRGWHLPGEVTQFQWLTSPLGRARETARLLGHPQARIDERLIEMSFGEWEGRRTADLRVELGPRLAEIEMLGLDLRPPGGESPRDVQMRLRPLLEELGRSGADVLAVTHKSVIRAIHSLATGWLMEDEPRPPLTPFALHIYQLGPDGTVSPHRLNLSLKAAA